MKIWQANIIIWQVDITIWQKWWKIYATILYICEFYFVIITSVIYNMTHRVTIWLRLNQGKSQQIFKLLPPISLTRPGKFNSQNREVVLLCTDCPFKSHGSLWLNLENDKRTIKVWRTISMCTQAYVYNILGMFVTVHTRYLYGKLRRDLLPIIHIDGTFL